MPIKPNAGEDQKTFVSRCIAHEVEAGHPQDQAAAICYKYWREAKDDEASILSVPRSGQNSSIAGHYEEIDRSTPLPKSLQPGADRNRDLDDILPIKPLKEP